uniref:DNA 3'-5' helicase n=1 Tax=Schistosoma mansoni TaxID=6183 RepID=A0A5K4EEP8_SCHMA
MIDLCLNNFHEKHFIVKPVSGSIKASVKYLYELINKNYINQSGIVYCFSQKDTEDVSSELKNFGLKVAPYHANLDFNYRSTVHSGWSQGKIQVIVATVAFGMGIDKADVRFVIHFSSSKSLENYYQESGRAGRDSNSADCILMWRFSDLFRLASMVSSERTGIAKLYQMVGYCIDPNKCRRYLISKNLGDTSWSTDDCKNACDNCQRKSTNKSDVSTLIQIKTNELLNATKQLLFDQSLTKQERITGPKLIDLMTCNKQIQSISQKLLNKNQEKPERQFYEHFISWCLIHQYLKLDFHFTPYSTVCYVVNNDNIVDNEHIELMPYLLSNKKEECFHVDAKRKRIHSTEIVDLT